MEPNENRNVTSCKYCHNPIEWGTNRSGGRSAYEPETDRFHRCMEREDYLKAKKGLQDAEKRYNEEVERIATDVATERRRKSIVDFYLQHEMEVPKQYTSLERFKDYEDWASKQPPAKIPVDIQDKARALGLSEKFFEDIPF